MKYFLTNTSKERGEQMLVIAKEMGIPMEIEEMSPNAGYVSVYLPGTNKVIDLTQFWSAMEQRFGH